MIWEAFSQEYVPQSNGPWESAEWNFVLTYQQLIYDYHLRFEVNLTSDKHPRQEEALLRVHLFNQILGRVSDQEFSSLPL